MGRSKEKMCIRDRGYSVTAAKAAEVEQAVRDGANEIDMVVNISDVKNHQYGKVEAEIRMLKEACQGRVLKVIIETCFLTEEEKIAMCQAVTKAGADYIKTCLLYTSVLHRLS